MMTTQTLSDRGVTISREKNADKIRLDTLGILTFLCGAAATANFNVIGEVYIAELALIPLALGVLIFKGVAVLSNRSLIMFGLFGIVMLSGYIITDIVVGTHPSQYMRGWGRVGLLITNTLALIILAGQGKRYIWWFILGIGVGGVVILYLKGMPLGIWKLGYAEKVTMLVIAAACVLPMRLTILLLITFGIFNIALDYRSFGSVYLLVAMILWSRSGKTQLQVENIRGLLVVGIMLVIAVIILYIGFSITKDEYSGRRSDSNIGRLTGIIVSIRAIADSPIIGYGSWTENEEYARMLREEQAKRLDRSRARRAPVYGSKIFRSHSQLLQPWVEAGIFGVSFFLYYAYRLFRGAKRYVLDEPVSRFTPINLYFVILGTWHVIASPFGGEMRIYIAVTIAILAGLDSVARQSVGVVVEKKATSAVSLSAGNGRILKHKKLSGQSSSE